MLRIIDVLLEVRSYSNFERDIQARRCAVGLVGTRRAGHAVTTGLRLWHEVAVIVEALEPGLTYTDLDYYRNSCGTRGLPITAKV